MDRCRIERDRKGEIKKIDENLDWLRDRKSIDVDRSRIEWDRKGETEKDRREFRLTKR